MGTFKIFRTQCGGEFVVEVDEGGQKVKIPSYKINNYWGYNVQHDNDN